MRAQSVSINLPSCSFIYSSSIVRHGPTPGYPVGGCCHGAPGRRRGKAVQLRDLGQQARLALESLPPTDSPCLGVVLVQLRAMQSLCTSWIEWWDEIQDIPREFAQPEPELHPLLGARPVRPGSVPPYVSVVRTLCDEIKLLSTTLAPDERQHLRSALVMAHAEVAPLADALQWDALRCLGWELNELAPQLE